MGLLGCAAISSVLAGGISFYSYVTQVFAVAGSEGIVSSLQPSQHESQRTNFVHLFVLLLGRDE